MIFLGVVREKVVGAVGVVVVAETPMAVIPVYSSATFIVMAFLFLVFQIVCRVRKNGGLIYSKDYGHE